MSVLSELQSWFLSTVQSRRLLGRRLVISFPTSLDKRVGVIDLPLGSSHLFVIKEMPDGQPGARIVLVSDAREVELGQFASKGDAQSALGGIRRSFTRPLRKAIKWLVVLMLWGMMIEWATTPAPQRPQNPSNNLGRVAPSGYGALGASGAPGAMTMTAPANQALTADLLKQIQNGNGLPVNAPATSAGAGSVAPEAPAGEAASASAPMPGGSSQETAAALKLLTGK